MTRLGWPWFGLVVLAAALPRSSHAGEPSPALASDIVRDDWYLRESLTAIRDWEDILARWEKSTPEAERTPRLPVPRDGQAIEWPNPIPLVLMPARDRGVAVRLRWVGGKIEIQRTGPNGVAIGAPDAAQNPLTPGPSPADHFVVPGARGGLKGGGTEAAEPGREVVGYRHPGGGGKDQWYHKYVRRFDRLTTFRAQPAAFALRFDGPVDFHRGQNELAFHVRNAGDRPLALDVQLELLSPKESHPCGKQSIAVPAGGSQPVRFPVELCAEGGGLLILRIEAGGESHWMAWFTHVEDVTSILAGVDKILSDTPSAQAAEHLVSLRRRTEAWQSAGLGSPGREWSALFAEASQLRDELLLGRLQFASLLFLKRKPFFSEQPFMDAHHLFNRPGGGLYRLQPPRPAGRLTPVVDSLGEGVYRDVCLDWDAKRLLFAFGNGSDSWDGRQSYHVYECNVDGGGLRQLTSGPKNDCEPFYLPDGQIGFTSDRSEHFVMCGGDRHSPNLFVMNADGLGLRRLSFNVFNDYTPTVLPDGRILYGRWEYNERSVTSLHDPFAMNPDGTMVSPYYGNATIRPNVVMFPRPVPGSRQVMALFTAHHGQTHGAVGLIDVRRGTDGPAPLTLLTPNVPVTGERAEDSRYGWFSDPTPLAEDLWLCSYTPTVLPWLEWTWALYVADRHGNLALVYRDPAISCAEPVPLVARPRPHVLPSAPADCDAEDAKATLVLADVSVGLPEVARGEARYLRILEDVPRRGVHRGGVISTSGTGVYTIKRILGVVPIEDDGSAHFSVPANRNVYFEVLDRNQREIQRMRSVVCLKPGETRSCVGCHEPRNTTPPCSVQTAVRRALARSPSQPAPPPWGTQILSFLRDVQPVLNARCAGCHTHDREACRVILTDDLTDRFCVGYEELLPYLSVANAVRWDIPEDVYARSPYTYGSKVSRLMQLLDAGHHDVRLPEEDLQRLATWIDANGVYYDRYETGDWPNRSIFHGAARRTLDEVFGRRCAACHGRSDGQGDTWWLSINRRDVRLSRALAAPLARAAGGWGRCDRTVFADTSDADYRTMLEAFSSLSHTLVERPREDLLSLRGTPAEMQAVVVPAPPTTRRTPGLPDGDWVYLSDVKWESAQAGWSRNGDGLPRRDQDIEDHPLRLQGHRYRKGLGTHAPSEIVYGLDGKYLRFYCVVGAAERNGSVTFQVFGDDRCLFQSGLLHGLGETRTVDVSVAGVRRLRLVVTDAGNGIIADMANWADARLLRAPPAGK